MRRRKSPNPTTEPPQIERRSRWRGTALAGGQRILLVLATTVTLSMVFCLPAMAADPERTGRGPGVTPPNIVLFFVDDLGYGNLGVYGSRWIETPRLDEMAAEGLRFTDFYSGDAWCPAARNTLMAGQHTGHTQLRGVGVLEEDAPEHPLYLPRFLQNAGYVTGMFGKWGLGSYFPEDDVGAMATGGRPSELGFDEFFGMMKHRDAHTLALPPYPQEPTDSRIHNKLWRISGGQTIEDPELDVPFIQDDVMVAALDFIDRHQDAPFFLYLPSALPHAEYYLPDDDPAWDPYLDASGVSLFPETPFPGNVGFRRPVEQPKAAFAALVTRMDTDVGRVLDHLQALDLEQDTLVFFVSDNGPAGDGGFESPEFFDSSGGLRGLKLSLYEGGIRVPMIAWGPGTVSPGVTGAPMAVWDFLPTILDAAGVEPPVGLDGLSFLPLLTGDPGSQPVHDEQSPLYWETFNGLYRSQATRLGQWKAVRPIFEGAHDRVEIYDLDADPSESIDLSDAPESCALAMQLEGILNASRVPPPSNPFGVFDIPA
ncbi:MAG: sulfatase-like hydrolase/transferase, partial [Acidobacteriota bacterium]